MHETTTTEQLATLNDARERSVLDLERRIDHLEHRLDGLIERVSNMEEEAE